MDERPLEEEYMDVLQNTEAAIVWVYRQNPELMDYQVDSALEALIKTYQGEATGRKPAPPRNPAAGQVYERVQAICDIRLGRETFHRGDEPVELGLEPVDVDVILRCLKRIRKSIQLWTREGGRQGYLNYVSQFIP